MMTTFAVHPAAELFPEMTEEEKDALKIDIALHGLKQPIVLCEGMILDGRHRMGAIEELEAHGIHVEPAFSDFTGSDPYAYAVSLNFARRHLNYSQRLCIAVQYRELVQEGVAPLPEREGVDVASTGRDKSTPKTRDLIAAKFQVSGRHIDTAARVKKDAPNIFETMHDGGVSVWEASHLLGYTRTQPKSTETKSTEPTPATDTEIIEWIRRTATEQIDKIIAEKELTNEVETEAEREAEREKVSAWQTVRRRIQELVQEWL